MTLVNSYVTMTCVSLMITDVMVMISVEITVMRVDVVSGSITLPCMSSWECVCVCVYKQVFLQTMATKSELEPRTVNI